MSKFNFLVYLNNYSDQNPSNNASLNNFKWTREINGLQNEESISEAFVLAPSEQKELFSGVRTLAQDNTTTYDLSLKPFTTNIYRLDILSGPQDYFRAPRTISVDATTEITTTKNGSVITFTSTAGTALNTAAVVIGDSIRLGDIFPLTNQGEFKVIAKTSNSVSVINNLGTAAAGMALGASFAEQFQIYSSSGIQIGDRLLIDNGFSIASFGTYAIKDVSATYLEFYSTASLPEESTVQAEVTIYSEAKQFVYIEATGTTSLIINGVAVADLEPFVCGSATKPGVFMLKSTIFSLEVLNKELNSANIFLITVK